MQQIGILKCKGEDINDYKELAGKEDLIMVDLLSYLMERENALQMF